MAPWSAPSGRDWDLSMCMCTHVWGAWGACACLSSEISLFPHSSISPTTSSAQTGATAPENTGILLWVSAFRKLEEVSPPLQAKALLQDPLPAAPSCKWHQDWTSRLTVQLGKERSDCSVCSDPPGGSREAHHAHSLPSQQQLLPPPSQVTLQPPPLPSSWGKRAHSVGCPTPGPAS